MAICCGISSSDKGIRIRATTYNPVSGDPCLYHVIVYRLGYKLDHWAKYTITVTMWSVLPAIFISSDNWIATHRQGRGQQLG